MDLQMNFAEFAAIRRQGHMPSSQAVTARKPIGTDCSILTVRGVYIRIGRAQDMEDLVAETFVQAISKLATFEKQGPGYFAAWLFRIAHNRMTNFYRHHQRVSEAVKLNDLPEIAARLYPMTLSYAKSMSAVLCDGRSLSIFDDL